MVVDLVMNIILDQGITLNLILDQNEYSARLDNYGYQNQSQNITYTNNFKSVNFSLSNN